MLSTPEVAKVLERFVVVKSDPRDSRSDPATRRYKVSRYVPEVVLLSPDGTFVRVLEGREVPEVVAELETVLRRTSRS